MEKHEPQLYTSINIHRYINISENVLITSHTLYHKTHLLPKEKKTERYDEKAKM